MQTDFLKLNRKSIAESYLIESTNKQFTNCLKLPTQLIGARVVTKYKPGHLEPFLGNLEERLP